MRALIAGLIGLAVAAGLTTVPAAAAVGGEPTLLRSELLAERTTVAPGSRLNLAVRQHLAPGWHTYWRNPGNIGQATRVTWSLPPGWQAGELQWPTPRTFRFGGFTNFVYAKDVVLPLTMTVPADAPKGPARLTVVVSSLLCRDVCLPTRETLSLTLDVAASAGPEASAPLIADTLARIARRPRAEGVFEVDRQAVTIALPNVVAGEDATFFPLEGQGFDADAPASVRPDRRGAVATLALKAGQVAPARIAGLLADGEGGQDVEVTASAGDLPGWASGVGEPGRDGALSLIGFILLAFGGGLILNAMPCVFPILAGKAATLAAGLDDRATLRREGLAYCLGALVAFVGLAGVLIVLRAMGHAVGWGFQLQSPVVVAILALVMLASALNLAGVFEAGLWLQNRAGGVGIVSGDVGALLTGALAALVAAPCTAPLMAPAIGWAMTQPAPAALSVFAGLGLGLGAPYLLLAWLPGASRLLPRPGPWLGHLRRILAFPMLAGAAWLVWVFVVQTGPDGLPGLLTALVGLAFALWCLGLAQSATHAWRWRLVAGLASVALVPTGLAAGVTAPVVAPAMAADESWSPERVDQLLAQGHPVLVDVTAAWCVTCKVNDAAALDTAPVRRALRKTGARLLKADWTRPDARIERFLAENGRSGAPFYLVYAPDGRKAQLPQILTAQVVTEALETAARQEP